jgi:hypothetical protein
MTTTTAVKSAAMTVVNDEREPINLQKRIGSTLYEVSVRFSQISKETIQAKISRLIEREVQNV